MIKQCRYAICFGLLFIATQAHATVTTNLPFVSRLSEIYDIMVGPFVVWIAVALVIITGIMFFASRWIEAFGTVGKAIIGISFVTGAVTWITTEYGYTLSSLL